MRQSEKTRCDFSCKPSNSSGSTKPPAKRGASSKHSARSLPSARIYGRYEVLREVASTAGSRVIECVDGVRSEHVAIKIYAGYGARGAGRDVLARFERELRVLASLDHPNVVPLLDYFPDGPALVLAWMPGGTLEQMLERGPIAPSRAVEIACAILAALDEAHRLGVLHRDIKPSNVLFDAAGAARLADFGAAHLGDLSATATAGIIGTLSYMSPEQRNGEPASITSDVYGVGALLFEMLTGEHVPHDGSSPRAPSLWHPDLDARHDAVALSLLAPEPAARPSDARVARRALTALAWPASPGTLVKRAPPSSSSIAADETSAAGRVRAGAPGEPDVDTWLQRPILRIPLDPLSLARAAAFARADHALLQRVFRVDRRAGEIWLDANDAGPLARPLTADERAVLSDALDALHRTGTTHGKVDRDHIRLQNDGTPTLAFTPECGPAAIMDDDHSALSRL